jgi:hypothetical protein
MRGVVEACLGGEQMSARDTTAAIRSALALRFCAPEWACFFEVPNATGAINRRSADMVAMNLFPSRGLIFQGVEIKASRGDLLKELRSPEKAEEVARYCDFWSIAAPRGLVQPGELPEPWGLLELCGEKALRQRKAPKKLKACPLDRAFVAALLRCASTKAERELRERLHAMTADLTAKAGVAAELSYSTKAKAEEFDRLQKSVREFEEASGIRLSGYSGGKELGLAVALVQRLGGRYGSLKSVRKAAEDLAKACAVAEGELDHSGSLFE